MAVTVWRLDEQPGQREAWRARAERLRRLCPGYRAELLAWADELLGIERWPSEAARERLGDAPPAWGPGVAAAVVVETRPSFEAEKALPVLETARLRLRPLRVDDAEAMFEALGDPATMRYWSRGPFSDVEALRAYMAVNVEAASMRCWAVCAPQTGRDEADRARGWVVLIEAKPGVHELGYILVPSARGRGWAREAVGRVVEHAFDELEARRLVADIDPDNVASIALVEAIGFRREGLLPAEWETHIGVRDTVLFGLVRSRTVQPSSKPPRDGPP